MNGIFLIDKEKDYTSRDIVNIISKKFNIKKVGHTGTLDPLATGVLIVAVGKCTKLVDYLTSTYKEYIATMKIGIKTDTMDITGSILKEEKINLSEKQIINAIKSFKKTYDQTVPIYSAKKVGGKKLYEYAREKKIVDLPKNNVTIKEIEILKIQDDLVTFRCLVSKGTYIRSLIEDIALSLNTIATMTDLRRTKQGKYNIIDCKKVSNITKNDLIEIENIIDDYTTINLNEQKLKIITNGGVIKKEFLTKYCIYKYNGEIVAVYQEKDEMFAKPFIMYK